MKHLPTLSDRQHNLLMFVAHYIWEHGYQPMQTEMATHMGITPPSARLLLIALESKGYLKRVNKKIHLLHVPGYSKALQPQALERVA